MTAARRLYSIYALFIFSLIFALLFPLFLYFIYADPRHPLVFRLHRYWARLFFFLIGMPLEAEYRHGLDSGAQYIFCPNHFSYLDIPTMGYSRFSAVFVGKDSLSRIPLFGFMYARLHITLDRSRKRSSYAALERMLQELDRGRSLIVFPEGGIFARQPPAMAPFREGPFRAAITKQIPVVPVTIPHNWIILPDDGNWLMRWKKNKVIFHTPIVTAGLGMHDLDDLKRQVADVIAEELKRHYPHAD